MDAYLVAGESDSRTWLNLVNRAGLSIPGYFAGCFIKQEIVIAVFQSDLNVNQLIIRFAVLLHIVVHKKDEFLQLVWPCIPSWIGSWLCRVVTTDSSNYVIEVYRGDAGRDGIDKGGG